jgi:NhaP-type Na+/H+ or K+/H+ antiporter
LNVESGLNDGVCVPILFVLIALAADSGAGAAPTALVLQLVAEEIGIGLVVGAGFSIPAAWLTRRLSEYGWITETWQQLTVPALAVACFAVSQWLGGSGFIACFSGGLLFGALVRHHKHKLLLAAEGTGDMLSLVTWVVFGAGVIGQAIGSFSWDVVLYALLSLSIVRMLPVFLSLSGMNLGNDEKLFIGWFGPRGLASIVFAVIVINQHLPSGGTITITVVCTITLSVIAHGLSANPLVAALVARKKSI